MVSKILIGFSLICFLTFGALAWVMYSPTSLSFAKAPQASIVTGTVSPKTLEIPSLGLVLSVSPAEVKNNRWPTTAVGVSYLTTSAVPGNTGNSIIYGHNWQSILGKLPNIRPGQTIVVRLSNGETRQFIVQYTAKVSPSDISVLDNTNSPRLTVYTCVGFLDQQRFVVVATPV